MTLITRKIQYLWEIVGLYFTLAGIFIKDFFVFYSNRNKKVIERTFTPSHIFAFQILQHCAGAWSEIIPAEQNNCFNHSYCSLSQS